ncbi:hypothetical protein BU16DRAFT_93654 [Lophium mytilinum]|uniref:Uncharacterized protein n=1 Tax=Lophium mytilinum TaxID=390894 RepID=A0A6A6QLB7_9PEZI|nr:hypothetical protein BU16DRAFT_93654 [Lophium mytilinum]
MPVLPSTVSKPPPPIQTLATSSSESRLPMAQTPPAEPSPASFMSRRSTQGSTSSTTSPVEATFFETIASKVKRGRSRSRSRQGVPRNRSKSPLPPDHLSSSSARTSTSPPRPQQTRHFSTISQDSTRSSNDGSKRFDPTPTRRATASSDPWRGRHANSWLFNDFSVTDHAKDLFHRGKISRS